MEEDLAGKLGVLKVNDLEKISIELPKELTEKSENECRKSVIIKALTDKTVSFDGMQGTLSTVWRFVSGFKLMSLGTNFFQVQFDHEDDIDRVLAGCPWYHDNYLLVIKPWKEDMEIDDKAFNIAPVWVQIWNLPLRWASIDTGKYLCNKFGIASDAETIVSENTHGKIIRVEVTMDISKPLIRGMNAAQGNTTSWATLKYENLSYFCYYCGIIGHANRSCPYKVMDQRRGIYKDELYGPELRAPLFKQKLGKSAVVDNWKSKISGFSENSPKRDGVSQGSGPSIDKTDRRERRQDEFEQQMEEAMRLSLEEEYKRKGKAIARVRIAESSEKRAPKHVSMDVDVGAKAGKILLLEWHPTYSSQGKEITNDGGSISFDETCLVDARVDTELELSKRLKPKKVNVRRKPIIVVPKDSDADANFFISKRKCSEKEDDPCWSVVEPNLKKLCIQDESSNNSGNRVEAASPKWLPPPQ